MQRLLMAGSARTFDRNAEPPLCSAHPSRWKAKTPAIFFCSRAPFPRDVSIRNHQPRSQPVQALVPSVKAPRTVQFCSHIIVVLVHSVIFMAFRGLGFPYVDLNTL